MPVCRGILGQSQARRDEPASGALRLVERGAIRGAELTARARARHASLGVVGRPRYV
jgi:hypothetical protein